MKIISEFSILGNDLSPLELSGSIDTKKDEM